MSPPPPPGRSVPAGQRPGGTSQVERLPADLLPEHLQLDARTLPELLDYVARFSEKIQFYTDPAGPAASTWALARHRGLLLLALIAARPSSEHAAETLLRPLHDPAASQQQQRQARRGLLKLLHEQARALHDWHTAWVAGARLPELDEALAGVVARVAPALREAAHYERLLAAHGVESSAPRLVVVISGEGSPFLVGIAAELLELEYLAYLDRWHRAELTLAVITESLRQLFWRLQADLLMLADMAQRALRQELKYRHDHHPDEALLVAFLQLYAYAQAELNDIPRRHLDYYYQQVLRVTGRTIVPDRAYFAFTLTQGVTSLRLPAGTRVEAGKDAAGHRVVFATTEPVTLGGWQIVKLAKLLRTTAPGGNGLVTGLYASLPAPPPAAGPPAPGATPWPLFGSALPNSGSEPARVGFAVASPLLSLQEGTRLLTLRLAVTPGSFAQWQQAMQGVEHTGYSSQAVAQAAFVAQVTGAAGWLPLTMGGVVGDEATHTITWTLTLERDQLAAVGYLPTVHGDQLATTLPVLRLLLAPGAPVHGYSSFALLQPVTVYLRVQVEHVYGLELSNQDGRLTNNKPFYPFGTSALPGSYLLLGLPELLQKNPTRVTVTLHWQNLPPGGFASYYQSYKLPPGAAAYHQGNEPPLTDDAFQVTTSYLSDYRWQPLASQPLFQAGANRGALQAQTVLHWPPLRQLTPAPGTQAGLLRIELTGPAAGFGSRLYPQALQAAVEYNGQFYPKTPPDGSAWPLPQPPYLPLLQGVSLAYEAEDQLGPIQGLDAAAAATFFHLAPFSGYVPEPAGTGLLLPAYPAEGELFVGLSQAATGQRVQLVFDLTAPGAPAASGPPLEWSYLRDDCWEPVPISAAHASLPGLGNSYSVTLDLPALPNTRQTLLPAGLWWLRAQIMSGATTVGRVQALHGQLVPAVRIGKGPGQATAVPYQQPVPAHTPVRLLVPQRFIATVALPQASFGGNVAEDPSAYYTRVSERLRHRARALTPWDYEHLVLEAFPQVHSALCLSARGQPLPRVPGQVTLVLLPYPDANPQTAWPQFGPGTLEAVRQYLQALAPPAVRVQVLNASYEQVQVRGKIVFQPLAKLPLSRCEQRLHRDLRAFLSPWDKPAALGGFHHYLTVPDVEAYLRQLPYVADLTGFSVVKTGVETGLHRLYDSATDPCQPPYLMGDSPPGGVQIAAQQHHFKVYQHLPAQEPPSPTGIDNLRVGTDFIVARDF